jgi:hypothetical protein
MKPGYCNGCDHNKLKEQYKDLGFGKWTNYPAPYCEYFGIHLEWINEIFAGADEICIYRTVGGVS